MSLHGDTHREARVPPGPQLWGHSWAQTRLPLVTSDVTLDSLCASQGLTSLPTCTVGSF